MEDNTPGEGRDVEYEVEILETPFSDVEEGVDNAGTWLLDWRMAVVWDLVRPMVDLCSGVL